jgi:hypothetical protein
MVCNGWLGGLKGAIWIRKERREHATKGFADAWELWGMLCALTLIQGVSAVIFVCFDQWGQVRIAKSI